jgi:hypothetical protein
MCWASRNSIGRCAAVRPGALDCAPAELKPERMSASGRSKGVLIVAVDMRITEAKTGLILGLLLDSANPHSVPRHLTALSGDISR